MFLKIQIPRFPFFVQFARTTLCVQVERLSLATPMYRGSPHHSPPYDDTPFAEPDALLDDGTACHRTGGCVKAPGHQVCMLHSSFVSHFPSTYSCMLLCHVCHMCGSLTIRVRIWVVHNMLPVDILVLHALPNLQVTDFLS